MRFLQVLLFVVVSLVLAACGSSGAPGGDPSLIAPSNLSISPAVALPGDSVTITGANFGTSAVVSVNGETVSPVSASDTAIVLTVPENGWGYPTIEVSTAGGSAASNALFVGAELGADELTGAAIQEALDALPEGGALRLGAGTYVAADTLNVDNRSLYGAGQDATIIENGSNRVNFYVEDGNTVALSSLKFSGDVYNFMNGSVATASVAPLNTLGSTQGGAAERIGMREERIQPMPGEEREVQERGVNGEPTVSTQVARSNGTFRLSEVTVEEVTVGSGNFYHDAVFTDFEVAESTFIVDKVNLGDDYGANVTVSNSSFTGARVTMQATYGASLTLTGSTINATQFFDLETWNGDGDLTVEDNVITVTDGGGYYYIYGEAGTTRVVGNTISINSVGGNGSLSLYAWYGALIAQDNVIDITENGISWSGNASVIVEGDTVSSCLVSDNTITAESKVAGYRGTVEVECYSSPDGNGDYVVTGNSFTALGDNNPNAYFYFGGGTLDLSNNSATAAGNVELDLGGVNATVTDNTLTALGSDGWVYPFYAWSNSSVTSSGNTFTAGDGVYVSHDGGSLSSSGDTYRSAQTAGFPNGYSYFEIYGSETNPADANIEGNVFTGGGIIAYRGPANEFSTLTLTGNTVTLDKNPGFGLRVQNGSSVLASDNTFTVDGAAAGRAIEMTPLGCDTCTNGALVSLTATGNTFTDFANALYFADRTAASTPSNSAIGITAEITGNVFDFDISAAPQVAELNNVKDDIDASGNVWGSNTDLATVEGYVTLSGDTVTQGGSILLDPISQP